MTDQFKTIAMEVTRLGLRYLGMYLVMRGVFDESTAGTLFADPMLAEAIGGGIIAVTESFFIRAKVKQVTA